ncbi:rust resistance kinase Lr10-like [Andrographis paniculata]|uniref:rust resistance kinase Lr10-like n=1 Tax=Andrographis paniculata TaxID=175694 RepID=UPI0021E84F25|nr:rust resistance kinase Lr10-like [Andrographis paniculata]
MIFVFLLFLISSPLLQKPKFASGRCEPARCKPSGPEVRFPFRLKNRQPPETCSAYSSDFELTCNEKNDTVLHFQLSVWASAGNYLIPLSANATVAGTIDYDRQVIGVNVWESSCLPAKAPKVNSSDSPFESDPGNQYGGSYTLFNCSGPIGTRFSRGPIECLNRGDFEVYTVSSSDSLSDVTPLSNCVKMYNVSSVPPALVRVPDSLSFDQTAQLRWRNPDCRKCESRGKICGFNSTDNSIDCFEKPVSPNQKSHEKKKRIVTAVSAVASSLVAIAVGGLCSVYLKKKRKLENARKIVRFLDDYRALRPTRYSYSDIKRITEGFKYKLGRGGYGTVFKGKLSEEIPVAVKILNNIKGNGGDFLNEVGAIGNIHHVNVVRLVGYCADGYRRALVYEYLENDSLEKYIAWGIRKNKLGWDKLYEISLGIAKGLEYLHQGCNQRILHFDIKPQNILLDHNLNPKVADFGLAKLCSRDKSVITMTAARGTIGYIAPEVFSRNFGRVSYKSDIYSFGMVLLNMVEGRKNFRASVQDSMQIYFPEWMYSQVEKGKDIDFEIDVEGDVAIVQRLIIVGLWCIQWYPIDRPSMKTVIQMMEEPGLPIMPPNPFASTSGSDAFADPSEESSLGSDGTTYYSNTN